MWICALLLTVEGFSTVTALNIANAILYKGFNEGVDITPMKLQRLLYLTYKEFYKRTNTLLFDEKFEVWKYGPVVRSVNTALRSMEVISLKTIIENIMEQF